MSEKNRGEKPKKNDNNNNDGRDKFLRIFTTIKTEKYAPRQGTSMN